MCDLLFQIGEDLFLGRLYFDREEVLLLAAIDGQHAVPRYFAERLLVCKIHLIDVPPLFLAGRRLALLRLVFALLSRFLGGHERAALKGLFTDKGAEAGLVRNLLRHDIQRAGHSGLSIRHFLVRVHIFLRFLQYMAALLLGQNIVCQALQPSLLRDARAGPSLGAVGKIEVLHFYKGLRLFNLLSKLVRELSLLLDALHDLRLALLKRPQIGQRFAQITQLLVGQRSRRFFSVSGDERDRIALVDQLDGRFHLPCLNAQIEGDLFIDLHSFVAPFYVMTSTIITHLHASAIAISQVEIYLNLVNFLPIVVLCFLVEYREAENTSPPH